MKNTTMKLALGILYVAALQSLSAQDAQSILKEMNKKQQERWIGIDDYTVTMSMQDAMGMQIPVYNEKITIEGSNTFRQIPQPIYERDMQIQAGFPPPEETSAQMAEALKIAAPHMNQGGPAAAFQLDWDQMIAFAEAGAVAYDSISDGTAEASTDINNMKIMLEKASLAGVENVAATSSENGSAQSREAFHIIADDLTGIELEQNQDMGEFKMDKAHWWIDQEHYVPLAFKMEGRMEKDGELVPITIGGKNLDYKKVGSLYEPYTKIYQISGLMQGMSKKDQKEMEKAKAELAKTKEEMAKMSPEQQAMMKKMMGNRLEEMEKMLEGGNFESKISVVNIAINEGPPTQYGLGSVDDQPALTQVIEEIADGSLTTQLDIRVGPLAEGGEVSIRLVGDSPVLMPGESISIKSAIGSLFYKGNKVEVTGASGSITADYRSNTHIRGTYTVDLVFQGGTIPTISGTFKSPTPRGPGQAPFGSPIPAGLFSGSE